MLCHASPHGLHHRIPRLQLGGFPRGPADAVRRDVLAPRACRERHGRLRLSARHGSAHLGGLDPVRSGAGPQVRSDVLHRPARRLSGQLRRRPHRRLRSGAGPRRHLGEHGQTPRLRRHGRQDQDRFPHQRRRLGRRDPGRTARDLPQCRGAERHRLRGPHQERAVHRAAERSAPRRRSRRRDDPHEDQGQLRLEPRGGVRALAGRTAADRRHDRRHADLLPRRGLHLAAARRDRVPHARQPCRGARRAARGTRHVFVEEPQRDDPRHAGRHPRRDGSPHGEARRRVQRTPLRTHDRRTAGGRPCAFPARMALGGRAVRARAARGGFLRRTPHGR